MHLLHKITIQEKKNPCTSQGMKKQFINSFVKIFENNAPLGIFSSIMQIVHFCILSIILEALN